MQLVEAMRYKPEDCGFDSLCGLGRRSVASRLLRLRVGIPLGAWIFVLCVVEE